MFCSVVLWMTYIVINQLLSFRTFGKCHMDVFLQSLAYFVCWTAEPSVRSIWVRSILCFPQHTSFSRRKTCRCLEAKQVAISLRLRLFWRLLLMMMVCIWPGGSFLICQCSDCYAYSVKHCDEMHWCHHPVASASLLEYCEQWSI